MKYLIVAATAVLLALHYAEGRPDLTQPHHPPMVSGHEVVVQMSSTNGSDTNTSVETTADSVESAEDDNITVQAKTAPMCPSRQPELVEIEKECLMEDRLKDPECTATVPTTEKDEMEVMNLTTEDPTTENPTTAETDETTTSMSTTETILMETTVKHTRKHRKRTCNYHLCILRRLDVLDSSDMPDKDLLTNWISNNITDIKQKEKMQERLQECNVSLQDSFKELANIPEKYASQNMGHEAALKKLSCTTAKKLIGCLSKTTECPVLKF